MAVGANATTFEALSQNEGLLPAPMAREIMREAYGASLVGSLAGSTPMPITGTTIAFSTAEPVAGVVGEGELKPVIKSDVATKTMKPIKVAAIAYWSKEARMANPGAFIDLLQEQARDAITRAIDMAVIHGKNAINGNDIAGVESVIGTTGTKNKIILGTAAPEKGGLSADILSGYDLIAQQGSDFSGFAGDPRIRTRILREVNAAGEFGYATMAGRGGLNLKDKVGDLLGLPIVYGKATAGGIGAVPDGKTRLIGGDWQNNLKFGFTEGVTFRKTDVGVIQDGDAMVNLFQQNMEAFVIEAMLGWIIRDPQQFVSYEIGE